MNDHDKSNLKFLLSLSEDGLSLWLNQCDADDYIYAIELLMVYKMELEEDIYQDLDLSEAQQVLSKFRIKHE